MNRKTEPIDMLHGSLWGKLLKFTLPIALSSMLQQLFNAADLAVVGHSGNADALAAVGTNTEIIALIVTLSSGLSIGANILLADRIGRKDKKALPSAVQTAVLLSLCIGIAGLFLGQAIAKPLLQSIQTPDSLLASAELYLQIYLLGYPFLMLYDFGSAVLRARGDSRYPFLALLFSGIINVGLNLFFVMVCGMGVAGAAIATDTATVSSAWMVLRRLSKDEQFCFTFRDPKISMRFVRGMLETGIPAAIQGAVFCFANIFVQASINRFGGTVIAGSTIAMNFEYFTYYIITAFGQTATTFTSQNFAVNQQKRCRNILWCCLVLSAVCSSVPIFTIVLFRNFFSGLFTPVQAEIQSAAVRILCILLFEPLCTLYEIPAGVLRGTGHALLPAVSTMIGTCAFRIVWILTVFRSCATPETLYHAFPLSWSATIVLVLFSFVVVRPLQNRR